MTSLILTFLAGITNLATVLIQSMTPAQAQVLWDRYIQVTAPMHQLLIKVEGLIPDTAPDPTVPPPIPPQA